MRLPFPERISLPMTVLAATTLFAVQQMQRTDLTFSIYSFLFIILANLAFNAAGGFTRPSGSYVFFYAVLTVIFGLFVKAYLGEPADSNLHAPVLTIKVHAGAMAALLGAVLLSRRLSRKKALLGTILKEKDNRNATIGALFVGSTIFILLLVIPHQGGSILTALAQVNRFFPLAIILGTLHAIKKSGGRKAYDGTVVLSLVTSVGIGLFGFGKEGIFTPFVCWILAAASLRYRPRRTEVIIVLAITAFGVLYLVPYSQYGRNLIPEEATLGERISLALSLLTDLGNVREQYALQQQQTLEAVGIAGYFNTPQGFAERLTMIPIDDLLINNTDQGNVAGYGEIESDFANWIPHVLWPDKPFGGGGNQYAREIGGIVAEDDTTTGISFSAAAEAFHLGRWVGIFVLAPAIWTMLFVLFDSLCGDTRKAPWGLLIVANFAHAAPEGMLSGAIYLMWFGGLAIFFTAFTSAYLLPIIGTLIAGPEKSSIMRLRPVRAMLGRGPIVMPSNERTG